MHKPVDNVYSWCECRASTIQARDATARGLLMSCAYRTSQKHAIITFLPVNHTGRTGRSHCSPLRTQWSTKTISAPVYGTMEPDAPQNHRPQGACLHHIIPSLCIRNFPEKLRSTLPPDLPTLRQACASAMLVACSARLSRALKLALCSTTGPAPTLR